MNDRPETRLPALEILDFWLGKSDSPEFGKVQQKWFEKDLAFDPEVRSR